ncbi:MAG: hypothetical protein ACRD4E_10580 [Bryobacteraceae bacterium]
MKATRLLIASACLLPAFAQTGVIAEGHVGRKDFAFYWQSRLEPATPTLANDLGYGSGTNPKNNNIYRVMIDRTRRVYFGYEVRVEPLPQGGTYRVAFQQLDLPPETFKQIHIDDPASWKSLELGVPVGRHLFPFREAPDTVAVGDVVAVDLMTNQQTNQKIVDYVVIQGPSQAWSFDRLTVQREFAYTPGTPRDFSVEDASLTLTEPRVNLTFHAYGDGKLVETTFASGGEISGPAVWFSLPNRGRFILSVVPHPELGFRKAGEVRGSSLTFKVGTDILTLNSAKPIAPGDAPFNLYVLQEPAWRPASPNSDAPVLLMGAAARAEMLIRK